MVATTSDAPPAAEDAPPQKPLEKRDSVVIRFCGDSGDGMQLVGGQFTNVSAILGNDISTLPDYPAEIRAPAGTLAGVSGYRKKLIEVALPLDAINSTSVRESYIYRGNPSAVHKWWAQRPLACASAVVFAQLVDDPSSWPDYFPTEAEQDRERQRLHGLIRDLITWENRSSLTLLRDAR